MVLTSTSHVAPHIAGCISSVVIYLIQVERQMVLISTVSTFFLSFFECRCPPAPQARQDGEDVRGEGADEHRSGRVTHCQKVQKMVRLPCPGRCPDDAVERLVHQHPVVRGAEIRLLERDDKNDKMDK